MRLSVPFNHGRWKRQKRSRAQWSWILEEKQMTDLEENLGRTGYEYDTLMNLLQVSVSKHLLDEHFTLVWANDFY